MNSSSTTEHNLGAAPDNEVLALGALARAVQAGRSGGPTDPAHIDQITGALPHIAALSKPMVRRVLEDVLLTDEPAAALDLLGRAGVFSVLLPEIEGLRAMQRGRERHKDVYQHTLLVVAQTPADFISRLAALFHDIAKPATKKIINGQVVFPGHAELGAVMTRRRLRALGFGKDFVEAVTLLVALHLRINSYEDDWTDSAARRLAREAGDQFERLLALSRADVTSSRPAQVERALRRVDALAARVEELRQEEARPVSPIDGTELMALFSRPPGPWIAPIKARLAALVESGDLDPADREGALAAVRAMVEADPENGAPP